MLSAGRLQRALAERFPGDPLLRAQAHWTQGNAVLYVPDYPQALEHPIRRWAATNTHAA